tara:strand:+ start:54 stop:1415 length:1362 start_codon:yes stop_codon:yes gene_type:complete
MGLLTPLGIATPAEFMAVQAATAKKLIQVATKQTGTTPDDWVVRSFMPDGGTGPVASNLPNLQTPDISLSDTQDVHNSQLGWDADITGNVVEPSTSFATINGTTTVPDQVFYGVFGWWEDAVYGGTGVVLADGTPNTITNATLNYPPITQAWRFVSGAQTLDMWMVESCHGWGNAVGGLTKSPIIYTQNSNINLDIWVMDSAVVTGTTAPDHRLGLFMLTCERVGETVAGSGIHTILPGGLVTSQMFQDAQNGVAGDLVKMSTSATNTPASDWLVRGFSLDDNGVGPLSNYDLSSDAAASTGRYGALAAGWQLDADELYNSGTPLWYTALTDTTVPDNKFFGFFGGFEGHTGMGFSGGDSTAPDHMSGTSVAAWALTKGASTVAFWPCQEVNAWYQNYTFLANKPILYEQNSTINIYNVANASNYCDLDHTAGLMGLTAERIGENISETKISG